MNVEKYVIFAAFFAAIVCTPVPAESSESVSGGLSALLNAQILSQNAQNAQPKRKMDHINHQNNPTVTPGPIHHVMHTETKQAPTNPHPSKVQTHPENVGPSNESHSLTDITSNVQHDPVVPPVESHQTPSSHTNVKQLDTISAIQEEALNIPVTIRIMFPHYIQVRNKWYPLKLRFGVPQP